MHLFAEAPLRPDAEAVAHQQHADQQLGIDRRPPDRAVEPRQVRPHALQIHEAVDGAEQVILRHVPLQAELIEECTLVNATITHHGRLSPDRKESALNPAFNRHFQRNRRQAARHFRSMNAGKQPLRKAERGGKQE